MANDSKTQPELISAAEIVLPAQNLHEEMPFFIDKLRFQLDEIFPADDPSVAVLSGHGMRIRLSRAAKSEPGVIILRCEQPGDFADGALVLTSPAGTRVEIIDANPPLQTPDTEHSFVVRRLKDSESWVIGRAGMHYRDLIPSRLGGSIIASHIRIPDGGPVPDMVHYHTVGFQLIFCLKGWVRLVYEDQGDPFILDAGNCVIQPPEIRHQVLEASDGLEVLEIGVPAEHLTTIDHNMELPNGPAVPGREWEGTKFIHHREVDAVWNNWRISGWQARDTGIGMATQGVAGVHVAKPDASDKGASWQNHSTDILFTLVKEGTLMLEAEGRDPQPLSAGDAFTIPPGLLVRYLNPSDECELIEVALPAET